MGPAASFATFPLWFSCAPLLTSWRPWPILAASHAKVGCMSRVINTENPGKLRNQYRRTIAEILRHLMFKRALDE